MHKVALVVFPQFQPLSLAVGSVFECANLLSEKQLYAFTLTSEGGGDVKSSQGFSVATEPLEASAYDTVIVSGYLAGGSYQQKLLDSVTAAGVGSRRIASLCTGVFLLAQAGLLSGKRVATHWLHAPEFKRLYPDVQVEDERLFVVDGGVWTGAGMASGVDLALAMVEHDFGVDLARRIARKLIIVQRRGAEQSQLSALLEIDPKSDRIQLVLAYARENLRSDLSIESLASVARLSPRQFSRVFRDETGQTPAKAIEAIRVEAARIMMETGRHPIEIIAQETGFGDRERLRQAFLRAFGKTPQAMKGILGQSAIRIN